LNVKLLPVLQQIADEYGNGTVHITSRQGFEIPDIHFSAMDEVNHLLQPLISELHINQDQEFAGYPAAGTRNVTACIGNRVCPFACYDTTAFAKRIEEVIFPNDLHFKIALTGCPNDCAKVRMHDFGIMGMNEPEYDRDRCISCEACVKACSKKSADVLIVENNKIRRDEKRCIGCGECVVACPTRAWTRKPKAYYRLTLMGRSGKKNPRLGIDFIKWCDADSIVKIIENTYRYVSEYIDRSAPGGKEHVGYIIDRTGVEEFLRWAMQDVVLPEKAEVMKPLYWDGIKY
jgi:anaerobic sulfite reductase subunit C